MFDGWAPSVVHEHFDADGVKTGHTVVTSEPLWSDDDREQALGLDQYEITRCPCGCGLSASEAMDPNRAFDVEEGVCYARRAIETVKRQRTKSAEDRNRSDGWADGVFWYIDKSFIQEPQGGARG